MRLRHAILAILIPFLLVSCDSPSVDPATEQAAAPAGTPEESLEPLNAWKSPGNTFFTGTGGAGGQGGGSGQGGNSGAGGDAGAQADTNF